MSPIQKVAILGGTGSLGQFILPALHRANFIITLITRPGSTSAAPIPDISTIQAAYDDLTALTSAFEGNDALLIIPNPAATVHTRTIVQAALAAGIKHVLTNEFGMNTFQPGIENLPTTGMKVTAQRVMEEELARAGEKGKEVAWTGVFTAVWFDWAIRKGYFWVDTKNRSVMRHGSGNQRLSMSRGELNGDAVVAVLKAPDKFRNRPAYFASHSVSTNELIDILNSIAAERGEQPFDVVDSPDVEGQMQRGVHMWEEDDRNGVEDRLNSKAWLVINTAAFFDEGNRWGMDYGETVEKGWDEGKERLREQLRELVKERDV